VPLIELLEGGWPWLLLFPPALLWAWQQRRSRWGRWCLTTLVVLAGAILPLKTQLPWYSHPLWLPFALVCAPLLAWLVERTDQQVPLRRPVLRIPAIWMLLGLLLLLATAVSLTPAGAELAPFRGLAIAAGLGWGCGGWWLQSAQRQQRQHGLISLVSGSVIALALLFSSPLWLWELNEAWSVRPVAALSRLSPGQPVQLQGYDERPSLNWYARQRIRRRRNGDAGWMLTRKPGGNCAVSRRDGDWALAHCR
jgi:4-amino-4-deoxy-L-arabinose transferase-like glycosyltransferase